ncbi:MAG TPA: uracil-DNA glycosylase [Gemmatimonadaceae bacterium]|nr:uracil-DNA glycosylase [Gemmatimonadaceae bacterium]
MDAKEQLRLYLQQRREAGERDLVLDQLDVDGVLALIGAKPAAPRPVTGAPEPRSGTRTEAGEEKRATDSVPVSEDWREVLRSSGASPERGDARPSPPPSAAVPPPALTPPASPARTQTPDEPVAPGLSIGDADRGLFSGPLGSLQTLDDVAKTIASCTRCPLYSTATNPVPGVGNPNADLMIVGEAPGQTEDEKGLPFVGAAGQLLTKILAAVDLKREDVFICNVLKHRPPGNRNPMPDEVTACSPYLFRQFELIRPKAILALGTFAAQTLLQTKLAIGKLRSQVHRFHGVPLIVTYHPAALLRNPSWKRPTWEDVQLVRRILDSATQSQS